MNNKNIFRSFNGSYCIGDALFLSDADIRALSEFLDSGMCNDWSQEKENSLHQLLEFHYTQRNKSDGALDVRDLEVPPL